MSRVLSVDVSEQLPFEGTYAMSGWIFEPVDAPIRPTLVYCIAGGGAAASAFDLEVDGFEDFSFARHLASRGLFVAAFDHPGVGTSTPVPDMYRLDVGTVASAHAHVVATVSQSFDNVRVVGLGHSMGGMVLDVMQARHGQFDAIVALGHGGGGLPEVLTAEEVALAGGSGSGFDTAVTELARARFRPDSTVPKRLPAHGTFFGEDVPAEVVAAMGAHQAELLYHCALQVLIPDSIAAEMAAIDVPVFIGLGERDLIDNPHAVVASYTGSSDVTLSVLAGAGHCQFQAANRHALWRRIAQWIEVVVR
jgi:pimeloyl-ACP methyl ester carboxylesterase